MPNLIGTAPNQIGTNADHGSMAFQDENAVNIGGGLIQADLTGNSWNQNTDISTVQPTLKLDFDKMFALDPRITFGRASTASYYDGKTSALAEQNLILWSQDYTNAAWTKFNSSIAANAMLAPDGTMTASALIESTANADHRINESVATTANLAYTLSVYAKAGARTQMVLEGGSAAMYATFDLSAGTYSAAASGTTAVIASIGGGWYRCSITKTISVAINSAIIYPASGGTTTYAGDGTSGIFIWGAQLEQRSSVSTYIPTTSAAITNYIPQLMTAAANQARFDFDPITGEAKGLLVEEQRTNYLLQSQFASGWTTGSSASITANQVVAPDGTLTAALIKFPSSAGYAYQSYTASWSAGAAFTASVFAQTATRVLLADGSWPAGTDTFTVTPVGNGWYRQTYTRVFTGAGTSVGLLVVIGGAYIFAASVPIWGAQLEAGSFATSYIPTTSAQVTRSADLPKMTGVNFSSWYNQGQGTLFAQGTTFSDAASYKMLVEISNAARSDAFAIAKNASNLVAYQALGISGAAFNTTDGAWTSGVEFKVAVAAQPGSSSGVKNGGTVVTGAAPALMPAAVQMGIGCQSDTGGSFFNGWIRRLTYFPKRLTNAELVEMTQ